MIVPAYKPCGTTCNENTLIVQLQDARTVSGVELVCQDEGALSARGILLGMRSTMCLTAHGLWVCGRRCSSHKCSSESDHVAIEGLPLVGLHDGEVAVLDLYDIARVLIGNVDDVFDVVLESGDLLPLHRSEVLPPAMPLTHTPGTQACVAV